MFDNDLENLHIEGNTQYDLLSRGLDLAKQIVWRFLQTKGPQGTSLYRGG